MSEMKQVDLPQGTIRYRDTGSGPPIVFVHGLLVNGTLWRKMTARLEKDFRCIVPDLPLGAHDPPLKSDADLSPPGLAKIVADFLDALDLEDVTLVGNDTGGAICQIVAANHPERLGRLALTPCDAYDNFLPPIFRPLQAMGSVPGGLYAALLPMRIAALRGLPLAFGRLVKRLPERSVTDDWVEKGLSSSGARRDGMKVLRAIHKRHTLAAIERLRSFDKPVLLIWATEDKVFPRKFAERLAKDIPTARLEWVEDSYTFVPEDQPERASELLAAFVREPRGAGAPAG